MKRTVTIIISLLIFVIFCVIARPLGQKGQRPLASYWYGLSHSKAAFDQSEYDFWVNIRKCCRKARSIAVKDGQSVQESYRFVKSQVMNLLYQMKQWLLYLFRSASSFVMQSPKRESPQGGDAFIAQMKDALHDVVNTSVADVREQVKLVANELEDLRQKSADIRAGSMQKVGESPPQPSPPPEYPTKHRVGRMKKELQYGGQESRKHISKKSLEKFDELLEYKVGKHDRALHAVPYQNPYYQPAAFQYQTQQVPQMMSMQQMPVAAQMYQPDQQMSAMAMQMQAFAMAMQAQASALMMQAQQQQFVQPTSVQSFPVSNRPTYVPPMMPMNVQGLTRQEKIKQLMQCLQQLGESGEHDAQRVLLLIDLESDIIEHLLAGNTGQMIDKVVQKRNSVLKKSNNLVSAVYNMIIDLATSSSSNDADSHLYHHFVRRSRRAKQSEGTASQGKRKFLMRVMYVLEHYYEMIEKMQQISALAN